MDDIRELSVNELIRRLHESVSGFVAGMENVIGMNREAPPSEISELRDRITERLKKGEEITDNRKVIGLLDLLSRDQAVLGLVKEDAEDWLGIIGAIERQMASKRPLTAAETDEIKRIRKMSAELKSLIRG